MPARIVAAYSVDGRIEGKNPAASLKRFLNYGGEAAKAGQFTPNPDFWAKGVDFSCASMWNSQSGSTRAGTAVSPRHVVFAAHYPISPGTRISFMGTDGAVHTRTLKAANRVSSTDLMVGALDKDLPQSVHPAFVLPADYERYIGNGTGLPTVTFDYEEKALVADLNGIRRGRGSESAGSHFPVSATRRLFGEPLIVGDSGNPCFLVINEDVILLYTVMSGGPGGGPALHGLRLILQNEMDFLAPGFRLKEYDFSPFKTK